MAVVDEVTRHSGADGGEAAAPIEVLVVDDDPDLAALAAAMLERTDGDLAVTVATGAPAGLERASEESFDAVVSDYHMPAMDGLAFLDRLSDVDPAVPGVVFSSDGSPAVVRATRDANVPFVRKRLRAERIRRLAGIVRGAVRDR